MVSDTGLVALHLDTASAPAADRKVGPRRAWWRLAIALAVMYALGLHALVGVMLIRSNFVDQVEKKFGIDRPKEFSLVYQHWTAAHSRSDSRARPEALVFIGDSMMRDLDTSSIARHTLNLAIPTDTTAGVLKRMEGYRSLLTARGVVLGIGLNDLLYRPMPSALENFGRILSLVPSAAPVVVLGVLPVDERATDLFKNKDIVALNEGIAGLCAQRPHCFFVPPSGKLRDGNGQLPASAHDGDGVHLSASGHDIYWRDVNAAVLAHIPPAKLVPPQR